MKPGDLAIAAPAAGALVTGTIDPMPSRPGKTRWWKRDQPALIVEVDYRDVGNVSIKKFKILLEGELWWVSGNQINALG